ncbi:IclR family transcriptional regulator [Glacieibacterium megasporae]|uniref:IclR family transcriptional regulator n=1 Tax=Glacieibacterium megasporae TaxID=2835787 RepID=UPI001C1DEEF5|nr:IclR family transcriptional regulator C-terminal domain-containing protein [Polymorphobacter megasporae]UAJ09076.1 helix-turn-helix domain-containing protein [Polymorphobacter megasporae]
MSDASPPATVKSATRTLDIIEYIVSRGRPLVAQEISEALGIPVSSLSYLLGTLVEREYLVRTGRRYASGPGLARLQTHTPVFSLADRVAPLVRTLRVQLNETASFFIRQGWEVEALATESSEHALRYAVSTGSRAALHGFSAGKALLAALADADLDRYLAETERTAFTATTIVAAASLRTEIDDIRRTGIAHTREEHTPGIHGMGRVARIDNEVIGAFSVAIPAVRFDAAVERRAADLLIRTADLLGSG